MRNYSDDEIREAVSLGLSELPDLWDDIYYSIGEVPWKAGFVIARRVFTVLHDLGIKVEDVHASSFSDLVRRWCEPQEDDGIDTETTVLDYERNWEIVGLPENRDPAEFAWENTVRGDGRLPVDRERYSRDKHAEDAALILTFFWNLQVWLKSEKKYPYCSSRKLAGFMGCSHKYVWELIRRLRAEGALLEVERATPNRAPRYRVMKEEDRVPETGYRRSGRSGRVLRN